MASDYSDIKLSRGDQCIKNGFSKVSPCLVRVNEQISPIGFDGPCHSLQFEQSSDRTFLPAFDVEVIGWGVY